MTEQPNDLPSKQAIPKRICISDIETNGFLEEATRIHCAVIVDVQTGVSTGYRPHEIDQYLIDLATYDEVWGHYWLGFDSPMIRKLYPNAVLPPFEGDTMVLSRLVHPDIKSTDFERAKNWREYSEHEARNVQLDTDGELMLPWYRPVPNPFPSKLIGSYSLKAWGYRMNENKDEYDLGFDTFNEEMFTYMMQDGAVTLLLYQKMMAHSPSALSVELEHRIARLCHQIEANGFPFDGPKAVELLGRLLDEREALRVQLLSLFPNWKVRLPDFVPKRPNKTLGYLAGVPVERWREFEFNPASRDHIADRLADKYGWKPQVYTDNGKPVVDDDVLSTLPYPEAQKLARFFLLEKRIGQLSEGNQAWLKVQKNGKIHARYTPNGTVTGRSTHSHPNISQVPRVSSEFGRECRELFHAPAGWVQLGADQQGLELRCLASDLAGIAGDGGHYAHVVTQGDVHTTNQLAAGLPDRDKAKTFIYAFLYGAGDLNLGTQVGVSPDELALWQVAPEHIEAILDLKASLVKSKLARHMLSKNAGATMREVYTHLNKLSREQILAQGKAKGCNPPPEKDMPFIYKGSILRTSFLSKTPGLSALLKLVKTAAKRGFIKGIDGRKVPIRSEHSALNMRLQNAGAVLCKQWGCDLDDALKAEGLKHGWDGDYVFLSWSHDEYQLAVRDRPDLYSTRVTGVDKKGNDIIVVEGPVADAIRKAGREAGLPFNFQCPLDVDIKKGRNWAECH